MNKIGLCVALLGCMALAAGSGWAGDITVNTAGAADHTTIGATLAAAISGERILVAAGTYNENNLTLAVG